MSQARACPCSCGGFCVGWGWQQEPDRLNALSVIGCAAPGARCRPQREPQGAHAGARAWLHTWHRWPFLTQKDGQRINHSLTAGRISPSLFTVQFPLSTQIRGCRSASLLFLKEFVPKELLPHRAGFGVFSFPTGPPHSFNIKQSPLL